MSEGAPHLPVKVAAEQDAVAFLGEAQHTIKPEPTQERGCMTVATIVCVGMAASTLVVDNAPRVLGLLCILLASFFGYGAANRFWAVDIHDRGLVWRHRRQRRQMPFTQIISFQDTDTGVVIDGGDELFVLNALSYPVDQREVMVKALRAVIPERETLATSTDD